MAEQWGGRSWYSFVMWNPFLPAGGQLVKKRKLATRFEFGYAAVDITSQVCILVLGFPAHKVLAINLVESSQSKHPPPTD